MVTLQPCWPWQHLLFAAPLLHEYLYDPVLELSWIHLYNKCHRQTKLRHQLLTAILHFPAIQRSRANSVTSKCASFYGLSALPWATNEVHKFETLNFCAPFKYYTSSQLQSSSCGVELVSQSESLNQSFIHRSPYVINMPGNFHFSE